MKVISNLSVLVILTAVAAMSGAQEIVQKDQQQVDPSLAFFVALYACRPGNYEETNVMAKIVGPAKLQHTINGMVDGACSVTLATPDGRSMHCAFSQEQLDKIDNQQFMAGALLATTDDPNRNAINTDMTWTNMKIDSCYFINE